MGQSLRSNRYLHSFKVSPHIYYKEENNNFPIEKLGRHHVKKNFLIKIVLLGGGIFYI